MWLVCHQWLIMSRPPGAFHSHRGVARWRAQPPPPSSRSFFGWPFFWLPVFLFFVLAGVLKTGFGPPYGKILAMPLSHTNIALFSECCLSNSLATWFFLSLLCSLPWRFLSLSCISISRWRSIWGLTGFIGTSESTWLVCASQHDRSSTTSIFIDLKQWNNGIAISKYTKHYQVHLLGSLDPGSRMFRSVQTGVPGNILTPLSTQVQGV